MPERLIREPWRLALFFTAVFGLLVLCLGVILWQQAATYRDVRHTQDLILVAIQKIDRNNQTGWKNYQSGERARRQLESMVAEEKRMNKQLIAMNRQELVYQQTLLRRLRRLERRRR